MFNCGKAGHLAKTSSKQFKPLRYGKGGNRNFKPKLTTKSTTVDPSYRRATIWFYTTKNSDLRNEDYLLLDTKPANDPVSEAQMEEFLGAAPSRHRSSLSQKLGF